MKLHCFKWWQYKAVWEKKVYIKFDKQFKKCKTSSARRGWKVLFDKHRNWFVHDNNDENKMLIFPQAKRNKNLKWNEISLDSCRTIALFVVVGRVSICSKIARKKRNFIKNTSNLPCKFMFDLTRCALDARKLLGFWRWLFYSVW